jgi:hypothetical protein
MLPVEQHKKDHCPNCNSTNLDWGHSAVNDDYYEVKFTCNDCGTTATEMYDMVFNCFEDIEVPEPTEEQEPEPQPVVIDEEYLETYHEIVSKIDWDIRQEQGFAHEIYEQMGTGGRYELAKELTDKFQRLHKGREWHGEFFDELDKFWAEETKSRA